MMRSNTHANREMQMEQQQEREREYICNVWACVHKLCVNETTYYDSHYISYACGMHEIYACEIHSGMPRSAKDRMASLRENVRKVSAHSKTAGPGTYDFISQNILSLPKKVPPIHNNCFACALHISDETTFLCEEVLGVEIFRNNNVLM